MDDKTKNINTAKPNALKTLKLKRETIKDLDTREKKQIKGGGGKASGVVMARVV
jgi:hypothetical protein